MTTNTATMKAAWKPNNLPAGFVYTGRAFNRYGFHLAEHPLHNPYDLKTYGDQAVPLYVKHLLGTPELTNTARLLQGWTLVCWNHEPGQLCHNAILAAVADGELDRIPAILARVL